MKNCFNCKFSLKHKGLVSFVKCLNRYGKSSLRMLGEDASCPYFALKEKEKK